MLCATPLKKHNFTETMSSLFFFFFTIFVSFGTIHSTISCNAEV